MSGKTFIGVDVSAAWIDIAFHGGGAVERIANEAEAICAWLARLKPDEVALVAFEPTGGYERSLRRELVLARLAFARVHPNELAAFRARRGVKAKTDPIDARLLADFAALELSGRGLAPLVEGDETLREMSARRRQLADLLHAERCRADRAETQTVRDGLDAVIKVLEETLDSLEQAIEAHIAAKPALAETAGHLRSLTGVGPITVQTLMGNSPNSDGSRARKSPRLSAWRPALTRAASSPGAPPSATAAPASGACCSTQPDPPSAGTPS